MAPAAAMASSSLGCWPDPFGGTPAGAGIVGQGVLLAQTHRAEEGGFAQCRKALLLYCSSITDTESPTNATSSNHWAATASLAGTRGSKAGGPGRPPGAALPRPPAGSPRRGAYRLDSGRRRPGVRDSRNRKVRNRGLPVVSCAISFPTVTEDPRECGSSDS